MSSTVASSVKEKFFRAIEGDRWLVCVALLFSGLVLATSFVFKAFWLDETLSWWMIEGGWGEIFHRVTRYNTQSPLYFYIIRGWASIFPPTEPVLRIPSIVATFASAWLVYRIGRLYFDRVSAAFGAIVFLSHEEIARTFNLRPYSFALFFGLLATFFFLRWLRRPAPRFLVWYAVLMTLAIYFHYLFSVFVAVHAVLLLSHLRIADRTFPRLLPWGVFAIVGALSLPGLLHLRVVISRIQVYFVPPPKLSDLFVVLFPLYIVVPLLLAVLFVWFFIRGARLKKNGEVFPLGAMIVWYLVPVIFYLAAKFSGANFFIERYFVWSVAGLAFLAAFAVSRFEVRWHRALILLIFTVCVADWKWACEWKIDEWDTVSAAERSFMVKNPGRTIPVIAYTNNVEGEQIEWFSHDEERRFLLAPFAYYPIAGDVTLVPKTLETQSGADYRAAVLAPLLRDANEFIFICRRLAEAQVDGHFIPVDLYYDKLFQSSGFKGESLTATNVVKLIHYRR